MTTTHTDPQLAAAMQADDALGLHLDQLDVDGALRDTLDKIQVDGDTRAGFLKKAALAGGGIATATTVFGALAGTAAAKPSPKHDLLILNYALTLEYLESAFYNEAIANGKLSAEALRVAKVVAKHENAHVTALRKTIPAFGKPVAKPKFNFGQATRDDGKFRATAQVLEDTGVTAYAGQGARIDNVKVLAAAGSILAVEARHAAWFRFINGATGKNRPAPTDFQPERSMATVLRNVKATHFIVG